MKWHPDKCGTDDSKVSSEAKDRFQAINEAYVVLSDENKRFWYDADLFDAEKKDNNATYGMNDFLAELTGLMRKTKSQTDPINNAGELRDLFMQIRDADTCMQATDQSVSSPDFGADLSHKRSLQEKQFCSSARFRSSKAGKLFGASIHAFSTRVEKKTRNVPRKHKSHHAEGQPSTSDGISRAL